MIRTLRIENYRCLRSVELALEPLTVFVGANASGKSSVFQALMVASSGAYRPEDFWAQQQQACIRIVANTDDGVKHERGLNIGAMTSTFPECQTLQLDLARLREANEANELRRLQADGSGLANVYATLDRKQQGDVARAFCDLVPMFADITLRPLGRGKHWILFQDRWRKSAWYKPAEVSDGSMLLLALLLLPYQVPPPSVIAIEEPERGLHPYLMDQLIQALRRLSKGEIGPQPVQVLLATHSAELLQFVKPEEVRFFSRSKESGETRVELAPTNEPHWQKVLQEYDNSLGDIWLSGGLGGVPRS